MFKTRWKLYELINKYPYKGSSDLAKLLGIKHKKIHKHLHKLLEGGLIKFERFTNLESKWGFYPISFKELLIRLRD